MKLSKNVLVFALFMCMGLIGCSISNTEIESKSQDTSVSKNDDNKNKLSELTVSDLMEGERRIWFHFSNEDDSELKYNSTIDSLVVTNNGKFETAWSRSGRAGLVTLEDVDGLSIDETLEVIANTHYSDGENPYRETKDKNTLIKYNLRRDDTGNSAQEENISNRYHFDGISFKKEILNREYIGFLDSGISSFITENDLKLDKIVLDDISMVDENPDKFKFN